MLRSLPQWDLRVSFPSPVVVGGARGSSGFIPDFGCRWRGPRVLGFHSRLRLSLAGPAGPRVSFPTSAFFKWGPRVLSSLSLWSKQFCLLFVFCFSLSLSFILHVVIISTHSSSASLFSFFYSSCVFLFHYFPFVFFPPSVGRPFYLLKKLVTPESEDVSLGCSFSG